MGSTYDAVGLSKGKNETEEFTIDELDDIMKKLEEVIDKELN